MSDSPLIDSLTAAVEARPDDLTLRLHLAELLVGAGRGAEAIGHAARVLAREPGNETAQRLMTAALGRPPPAASSPGPGFSASSEGSSQGSSEGSSQGSSEGPSQG